MIMINAMNNEFNNYSGNFEQAGRNITDLASGVRNMTNGDSGMKPLALKEAGPLDVICARGKKALNHSGNVRFRALIDGSLEEYSTCKTKLEKSLIVSKVVDAVRQASPYGGFIKQFDGVWYEVGDHTAREKTGQSFRDLLHTQYKSSTKAKMARRKHQQDKTEHDVGTMGSGRVAKQMKQISQAKNNPSFEHMQSVFNQANQQLFRHIKRDSPALVAAVRPPAPSDMLEPLDPAAPLPNFVRGISAFGAILPEAHLSTGVPPPPPALEARISASMFDLPGNDAVSEDRVVYGQSRSSYSRQLLGDDLEDDSKVFEL